MFKCIAGFGLKSILNGMPEVKRVGEVLDVNLKDGTATATILLRGENDPISISFTYFLKEYTLYVSNVKTGKPWLDALADIFKDKYAKTDLSKYLSKYGKVADFVKSFL